MFIRYVSMMTHGDVAMMCNSCLSDILAWWMLRRMQVSSVVYDSRLGECSDALLARVYSISPVYGPEWVVTMFCVFELGVIQPAWVLFYYIFFLQRSLLLLPMQWGDLQGKTNTQNSRNINWHTIAYFSHENVCKSNDSLTPAVTTLGLLMKYQGCTG